MGSEQRSLRYTAISLFLLAAFCGSSLAVGGANSGDDEWIPTVVELVEMDYQDNCNLRAEADWALLNGRKNAFEEKVSEYIYILQYVFI